jgi:hypothetical protein
VDEELVEVVVPPELAGTVVVTVAVPPPEVTV